MREAEFSHSVGRVAVAQICESIGYNGAQRPALEALTDVATRYLKSVAKLSANSSGRTQSNLFDVIAALQELASIQGFQGSWRVKFWEKKKKKVIYIFMAHQSSGDLLKKQDFPTSDLQSAEDVNHESSKAAVKLQKVYRSYRTRRRLADSAVVAEDLWWQAIEYARLNHSTKAFFNFIQPEKPSSRWSRISWNASKVGKGLVKDSNAKKLAFQHWIEAIDPRHRYGHNLNLYFDEWCGRETQQPFFYWLDIGDGKIIDLDACPRSRLHQECISYLGPQERERYEYIIVEGEFIHKQTGDLLNTDEQIPGSKWIFVMSASNKLYAGEKRKGMFHHSSFLAGGATLAAGRLVAECGKLKAVSAYSGHYRPTDESLNIFLTFLQNSGVKLEEVQVKALHNHHASSPENFGLA